MKLFSVWRFMEVEIATENFVCSLTGKHHFDAHGFDTHIVACHRLIF
ncbi:Uncharacterised protein [Vibrio cholerae]|nr:Uncharacterised protein [Vibrio cholerae]